MSKRVIDILNKEGPMLSGKLAHILEIEYAISNVAARQALSRARNPVNKIQTLSFDKNQKFFYLENQYMSQKYIDSLLDAIKESSQVNWIYICAFQSQWGYVSKSILPALVSSPIKKVKGHKLHDRVIKDLLKCHIIEDFNNEFWKLSDWIPHSGKNLSRAVGLEVAKKQVVTDFANWARNINFVGYDSTKKLFETAEFANFQWAFTAPTYIQPIYNLETQKNGFIIADILYGETATAENIQFFLNKISIIRAYRKLPHFMPVFLLENAEPEALKILKEYKVVVAFIRELFDEKYTQLLAEIVNVFTNASAIVSQNPSQIEKLFIEIAKSEGRYNDIIGDFFEIMVGYYYQQIGCKYLTIGKKIYIPDSDKSNELDLLVERDGKVLIVECKATHSALDEHYVEKWLNTTIPRVRKWLNVNYPSMKYEFQLWSLGGVTQKAKELLDKDSMRVTKYRIEYFDKEAILEKIQKNKIQHLSDIFRKYFKT